MSGDKICEQCGVSFSKRPRDSAEQWTERRFCSPLCSNLATASKKTIPLAEKFEKYAVKGAAPDDCWSWTGVSDNYGYGLMGYGRKQRIKAHRYSYEQTFGPLASGQVVRHKCDNPPCCNPRHLLAGSQKDNIRDMVLKSRQNPASLLNLRPGAPGFHGAGPLTKGEIDGKR